MSNIASVDIILTSYENGFINKHKAVEKLYKYYPECMEELNFQWPELVELMDLYVDTLINSIED